MSVVKYLSNSVIRLILLPDAGRCTECSCILSSWNAIALETGAGFSGHPIIAQVWDAATGARLLTLQGHTGTITALAWSPDSKRLVSASEDGTVRIWDAAHGNLLLTYRGHTGAVLAVAWSPNGDYIASAGTDKTVQVWEANTGKAVFTYRGHSDAVLGVAWSPDSKRVASCGEDGTIQVW